jgi:RNA polymerase sigma-70 factor (ECF subfamily)
MKAISNACFNKNARERPMTSLSVHRPGDDDGGGGLDLPETGAAEPLRVVLHAELERAVEAALARLPEGQRAAVQLKALGHSLQEIADALDVTPSNAGVLVHRGRRELARRLAPFLEEQAG